MWGLVRIPKRRRRTYVFCARRIPYGTPRERLVSTRSDIDIQHNIEAELFASPDVDETYISVKVNDGIVSLSGFVREFIGKYHAEDTVKRIAGVVAVANDIKVQRGAHQGTADPQIARAALTAIRLALPSCWQQIRPLVRQGSVTLEGKLEQIEHRDAAEAVVRNLTGVASVVNAIVLKREPQGPLLEAVRRPIEE